MKWALLTLIAVYRRLVSPMLPPACRFYPSCSEYAGEAIRRHGVPKGLLLGLWRLLRCQPFCPGGFDPVPDQWPRSGRESVSSAGSGAPRSCR